MKIPFTNYNLQFFKEGKIKVDEEIGETGTSIYGGIITNEDYNPDLTGTKALETYDKMRKSDGIVGAVLLSCELPIRAATFYVEPASDDKQDQEIAEFIEYNLLKGMTITWDDFLRQALLMLPFGVNVFEKVFTIINHNGKDYIGWRKFAPRSPLTIYKWETQTGEDGITQMLSNGEQPSIPIEKLLIFTYRKEGDNWLGTSLLRNSYRPWFFKQHIEKINAIAIERQGIGIPYAELPPNHTPQDVEKAKEILKNIRAHENAYLIKPSGWIVDFMDMKANSVVNPVPSIIRYNREIMTSALTQFLDLGSSNVGSKALSVDQSTTFHNNLTAIAKQICDVINNYAIKQLVDLNWDVKDYPTLKFTRIGRIDYQELATSLQSLTLAGVISPTPELEDYIRDIFGLPEKPELEEEVAIEKLNEKSKVQNEEKVKSEIKSFQEWQPPRLLTFAENKIHWKDLHNKMEVSEKEVGVKLRRVLADIQNDLVSQVHRILATTDNAEKRDRIQDLKTKHQAEYRKIVYDALKELFDYGKEIASHEMHKEIPSTPSDKLITLSSKADAYVETMNNDLIKEAKFAILKVLEGKKFAEIPITSALALIGKAIKDRVRRLGMDAPAIITESAINQGRRVAFEVYDNDIYALQRSEILDNRTCSFCEAMDGRVFKKDDPMTQEDGFHENCRGLWVEIMMDEFEKPQITGIPDSLRNQYKGL